MARHATAALALAAVVLLAAPLHAGVTVIPGDVTPQGGVAALVVPDAPRDEISKADRARIQAAMARYRSTHAPFRTTAPVQAPAYPFFPQAGLHGQDLYLTNFADLSSSSGILDWDCSDFTYDGHRGHDSSIHGFRAQIIGVPVYAALDGRVIDAHDGEDDMSIQATDKPANYVMIDHGDGYTGLYWHFKRGSVAVQTGQTVAMGTQIGLTGSSGYSTGPHLHFESWKDGRWFEPSAGPCRAGDSSWVSQPPVFRDFTVFDFYFAEGVIEIPDDMAYYFDTTRRVSTFSMGERQIGQRIDMHNLPAGITYAGRVIDPSKAVRVQYNGSWDNEAYRFAYFLPWFQVDLNRTGIWRFQLDINGQNVIDAPFTVVAKASQVKNRPPAKVRTRLVPARPTAGQVMACQVLTSLVFEDPDYDLVRYTYEWRVNNKKVRTVTSAALSDVLARNKFKNSDRISCKVTTADDRIP
jgi:murein DD-endopeptidase MepM/ murein hydrolase activator NlpD